MKRGIGIGWMVVLGVGLQGARGALQPLAPDDGAVTTHPVPAFRWSPLVEPDMAALPSVAIQLARDPAFREVVDEDRVPAVIAWYVPDRPLSPAAYWWRLRRVEPSGETGPWTAARRFTVEAPERIFRVAKGATFEAIRATFRAAATSTPARVVFEPGAYRLDPGGPEPFLALDGACDLAVDGSGASVTLTRAAPLLRLERCRRVLVRGFVFDYDPPVYTAVRVEGVDPHAGTVEGELLPGHAGPEAFPAFDRDRKGLLVDPAEGFAIKRGVPLVLEHDGFERIGEGRYRFRFAQPRALRHFAPGDVYVLDPRWYGAAGGTTVHVAGGEDVALYDLAIRGGANECLQATYTDRHALLHVRLERPEGRALSVNNGGHNHHNCRTGPWIEGCLFENTGDDICHVNGYAMGIESRPAPDRLRIPLRQPYDAYGAEAALDLRPGDRLLFFDAAAGRVAAERRVKRAAPDGRHLEVVLDAPLGELPIGRLQPAKGVAYAEVGNREVTQVYNASRSCNQFVFRNNTARRGRRVGCLAKGVGGWIEGNRFEDLGGGGVEFWNAPFEGLGAEHYAVRGNAIVDCMRLPREDAGIWCRAFPGGAGRLHRGLLIESNLVAGAAGPAIAVADAEGVVLRGNRIERPEGAPAGDAVVVRNVGGLVR